MRKKLITLMAAALLVLPVSACHGSVKTEAFEVPAEFDESKNYEITFWAKNDTNVTQTKIYKKAIEDFQKLYPNITVTMKLYTDYGKIYSDVITNIATKTTPNVCVTYPDHIATYKTGENVVVPLDSLFADTKYGLGGSEVKFDSVRQDEIVPQFLEECVLGTEHYALPYMRSTEALYINKTYVEKLGFEIPDIVTWDFMFEVADAAMEKDSSGNYKVNGQNVMIPIIYKSTDNMMIQMLKQKDAGYSDVNGNIQIFNDDTKDLLMMIGEHVGNGAFSTFKISGYPANFLNAGQCIFAIDSTAGATWMGSDAPLVDISPDKLVQFETVIRMVPQFDTSDPKMISQGPSICIFNKDDPQEVLASWLFAQFMITNDVQTSYAETEGYVPVTLKAQQSEQYQDYLSKEGTDKEDHYSIKIQASRLLIDNVEYTFTTPVFNGSTDLRDAAGTLIETVVKSIRRKEKVDDAYIEELYSNTVSRYHLDQNFGDASEKQKLGPLPKASKTLLTTLVVLWVLIGIYWFTLKAKEKKAK